MGHPVPCNYSQNLVLTRVRFQVYRKRAVGAVRCFSAVCLAHGHCQRMKFVEEAGLLIDGVGGEGLARELDQGFVAFPIAPWGGDTQVVSFDDTAQVFIGDGNGMLKGIEQDGIRRLWAYAGQLQKSSSQRLGGQGGQGRKGGAELVTEHRYKGQDRRCFAGLKAAGADEALQVFT